MPSTALMKTRQQDHPSTLTEIILQNKLQEEKSHRYRILYLSHESLTLMLDVWTHTLREGHPEAASGPGVHMGALRCQKSLESKHPRDSPTGYKIGLLFYFRSCCL